jgi:ribosomal protein L16 Arg81 hydroxylase
MSKIDFSYLIAPHTVDDFFTRCWQQGSLLIQRGEPERFRDLLAAPDLEAVLGMADQLPTGAVELIGKTNAIEHRRPESSSTLVGFFTSGSTIRVRGVERYFDPLAELCRSIERELGFPTRANLYCTPAGARGFDLHFDTHEVLVLQLLGNKQWLAYESTTKLPLEYVPPLPFEGDALPPSHERSEGGQDEISATERGTLAVEASLEAGDSLYLPRGFLHQAESLDEHSVHLTIGIHVFTWLDLLSVALVQSGYRHESLRQALPVGWLNNHQSGRSSLQNLRDCLNSSDRMRTARCDQGSCGKHDSHLPRQVSRSDPDGLDHKTKVEVTGRLEVCLSDDGNLAGLALGKKCFGCRSALRLPFALSPNADHFARVNYQGRLRIIASLASSGAWLRMGSYELPSETGG